MFIVKFKAHGETVRRFHVFDVDLAKALVWAGRQLGYRLLVQVPDGRLFGGN